MRSLRKPALLFLFLALGTELLAQGREYIQAHYTKYEYEIPMRDGVKLFTAVYVPKDAAHSYPILLERTPYTVSPYGVDQYPVRLGPSEEFAKEGFVFAYQDVRGRFMSEGVFDDLRPHKPEKRGAADVDESTDTYDTIDWLLKHVQNNNGRVGMWGISYPGFYVAAGMIDAHPALKAVSPQAPVGDCYLGDDCYHNGALWLPHNFGFYTFFAERKGGPQRPGPFSQFQYGTPDGYDFYLRMGPISNSNELYLKGQNPYWDHTLEHSAYDEFWKSRAITRFFRTLPPAILTVGGWFDAEDLSGALRVFRAAEKVAGGPNTHLVMGPWSHGGWAGGAGDRLGNLYFGSKTGEFFRQHIQFPFFVEQLKGKKEEPLPKAYVFQTGSNQWRTFSEWPPKNASSTTLYFGERGQLRMGRTTETTSAGFDEYVSDPSRPVPYLGYIAQGMTSDYMTEDQRFAAQRPDVLVYETEPLAQDVSVAGPVNVRLFVSTTGTDSDFVVKLIDVYPSEFPSPPRPEGQQSTSPPQPQNAVKMGGYQQLVRGEPFRGKFRNSFERPEPFEPGKTARIEYAMPDICHSFRKGHRIMVQVQSSWFPLADRNPQKFMEILKAEATDFQKATERVYHTTDAPSGITVLVEK